MNQRIKRVAVSNVGRLAGWTLALLSALGGAGRARAEMQPAMRAFEARLPVIERQIPAISLAAMAAAENNLLHPAARINTPYQGEPSFAEELIDRAGGLAIANPTDARTATGHDFVLLSVRSWEKQALSIGKLVRAYQARDWKVVLFASAADRPVDLPVDFFLDNGAPSGRAEHGRINTLTNVTLGWMWCCEYAAAMSRRGTFPAILYSVTMPGGIAFDRPLQTNAGRVTVHPCDQPIPAGQLATRYLKRVKTLLADLQTARVQAQIDQAARLVARQMKAGRTVGLSGVGHMILYEFDQDTRAPWKPFPAAGRAKTAFRTHLQPGELLVWISYVGVSSVYEEFSKHIREAELQLICSSNPDPEMSKDDPPLLAHIDQCWERPDAEVPIPIFPHKMAPVSAISAGLILRMLDDAVAAEIGLE